MKFLELWKEAADFLKVSRSVNSDLDNFLKSTSCVVDFWVIERWQEEINIERFCDIRAGEKFPVGTIGPHDNAWVVTIFAELTSDGADGYDVGISFRLDGNPADNMSLESDQLSNLMHVIQGTFR